MEPEMSRAGEHLAAAGGEHGEGEGQRAARRARGDGRIAGNCDTRSIRRGRPPSRGLLRLAHGWRSLGRVVQAQIVIGSIGLPALLADHAQRYTPRRGPAPPLVPWIVRVVALLTLILGLLLARLGRRCSCAPPTRRSSPSRRCRELRAFATAHGSSG
jgi:hypothetical protein